MKKKKTKQKKQKKKLDNKFNKFFKAVCRLNNLIRGDVYGDLFVEYVYFHLTFYSSFRYKYQSSQITHKLQKLRINFFFF